MLISEYLHSRSKAKRPWGFLQDEAGSITILGLLLLVLMLFVGAMAVDFMRFESRRARLQSVADRAVLAAAKLDQQLDAAEVVRGYFDAEGHAGALVGDPVIDSSGAMRSVAVTAQLELNTFFLRLMGMNTLRTVVASSAIEGTSNIEISLILDTSGSMGRRIAGGGTRMDALQAAANDFVDALLIPDYEDQISISLVSYSEHVSLGNDIYNAINATDPVLVDPDGTTFANPARCVDVPVSDFKTTAFDNSKRYEQVEHYDAAGRAGHPGPDLPICPVKAQDGIIPLSQSASTLKGAINALEPQTNTSIHAGLKWGVTLLDPTFRSILNTIPSIDPEFRGDRPSDYTDSNGAIETVKYVVLMTDGENVQGYRLIKSAGYATAAHRQYWANSNYNRWNNNRRNSPFPTYNFEEPGLSAATKNTLMQDICQAAKDAGIVIYTIAMEATTGGEAEMKACASSPDNHYFETSAADVANAFQRIARQITDLRLNQ